jgi:hypothetical protein
VPRGWLRGTFEAKFPAASVDGFSFDVSAHGRWRRTALRQHNPESAAASYVIDEVSRLAVTCSVLAAPALTHKANAHLGRAGRIPNLGVRMQWASVHIEVDPEVQRQAKTRLHLRARAKSDWEDRQLRITQAVTFRDLLREDPTLALAHLLLESPGTVTGQAAISTIKEIGEQVAAYAPGAAWVKTAQLLEKSFGELPPDAKQFIIDRIYRGLMEFRGTEEAAHSIMQVHGLLVQRATSNGRASDRNSSDGVTAALGKVIPRACPQCRHIHCGADADPPASTCASAHELSGRGKKEMSKSHVRLARAVRPEHATYGPLRHAQV